jgi:hypothetical protein
LALGATVIVPWVLMALDRADIEAVESPLILSVARQLEYGPAQLYGPYGGRNPLVLIHAPLYYRLVGLIAYPASLLGAGGEMAAIAAGRSVSALGLVVTLVASYGLARPGSAGRRAGLWAALLIAATPVCAAVPFEVRPDMLAVGLQTTGIFIVTAMLVGPLQGSKGVLAAFGCFAVAGCVKQHFVAAPLVSTLLLAAAVARGRMRARAVAGGIAFLLLIVGSYYALEEWISGGQMSRSVFIAAWNVREVHPASWGAAGAMALALLWKCVGIVLLMAAAGLARLSTPAGRSHSWILGMGTLLIAAIAALTAVQLVSVNRYVSQLIVLGLLPLFMIAIPAQAITARSDQGAGIDKVLWVFWAVEMTVAILLWQESTGAWFNYALQAVVILCVITARAVDRALRESTSWRSVVPICLAAMAVPAYAFTDVRQIIAKRSDDASGLARLAEAAEGRRSSIYCAGRPGVNRLDGRTDLVFDPWLYPVFESIGLAEPRAIWLERALSEGPVRIVATDSSSGRIDGLARSPVELGYRLKTRAGPFFVWVRP